jgi:hypothetical protein
MMGDKGADDAAKQAAQQQIDLANMQRQWALQDRQPWQDRLMPMLDAGISGYNAGDYNIISPELTSQQYDFFNKQLGLQEADQRTRLMQDLARRGIDATPERLSRSLGDFGSRFADVRTAKGLDLAQNAATTNWNSKQAERGNLLNLLYGGYSGGQAGVNAANQTAYQGMSDANSAMLAASNANRNATMGALGGLAGGITGAYNNYRANQEQHQGRYLQQVPSFLHRQAGARRYRWPRRSF